jgi:hypothetical protein
VLSAPPLLVPVSELQQSEPLRVSQVQLRSELVPVSEPQMLRVPPESLQMLLSESRGLPAEQGLLLVQTSDFS